MSEMEREKENVNQVSLWHTQCQGLNLGPSVCRSFALLAVPPLALLLMTCKRCSQSE